MSSVRRPTSTRLAAVIAASLLAGGALPGSVVGGDGAPPRAHGPTAMLASEATLPSITPDSDLTATLTVWGWEAALNTLQQLAPDFEAAYPNISVEYVASPPADTYRNLQLAVSAGSGAPDISVIEDSHLAQFVDLGALADITEQAAPYLPLMNAYKWPPAQLDGRTYAMPWDSGPVAVYYRRDVFEQAGVDPGSIDTWADFLEAARTIKETTGVPMWQNAKARNDGRLFEKLAWQRGVGYVDAEGAVMLDQDPRVLEVLEYLGRFWEEDLALDNEEWTDPWYKAFADGEVATTVSAVWMGNFLKSWIAPEAAGQWGVFELPVWEQGDTRASNDGGSQLAILAQSDQQEAAWAYVEFHLGRYESQLAMYEHHDFFPSLEPTYADPFFEEPDPYFGGDQVRALFGRVVAEVPEAGVYSSDYQLMNGLLQSEIQRYARGEQTAQEALADAARLIRDQTRRP